jgi:hypothetical protein
MQEMGEQDILKYANRRHDGEKSPNRGYNHLDPTGRKSSLVLATRHALLPPSPLFGPGFLALGCCLDFRRP